MPALFTSTSTLPALCSAFWMEAGSVTSTRGEPSRSQIVTLAPDAARRLAMAAPMPCAPPVTTAARPAKSSLFMGHAKYNRCPHGRTSGGKNRVHHRCRTGHGPGRRARLRARGCQGVGDRHQRICIVGSEGNRDPRARRDRRGGDCQDRPRGRRGGRAVQLRRHRAERHHPRRHQPGLGARLRRERALHVLGDARLPAGHAEKARRLDHQHGVGRLLDPRAAEPLRLRYHQGRGHRPHQGDRRRLREERHPLQRGVPGHGRHAVAAGKDQRQRRPGAGAQGLHRAPAHGAAGNGGRHHRAAGVPRLGRGAVRHRKRLLDRWGNDDMKLCRYGKPGYEKPGVIDGEGRLRDLSKVIQNIGPNELSPRQLKTLSRLKPETMPLVNSSPRLGVPYVGIGKFVAIGLNYSDHAKEAGLPIPSEPIVFMKATTCINGPNDDIVQPKNSTKLDWEIELGVVIGSQARYVSEADALTCVAGYCIVNDVSERAFQMATTQWDKGKGFDTAGPIGPWLVTADEVGDPQTLDMWLDVNGKRMQTGNTRTMVFSVAKIISHVSQYMTLMPGDIIATGTPPGVGLGVKPNPLFLKPGDLMTLGIQGLGEQRQRVVGYAG